MSRADFAYEVALPHFWKLFSNRAVVCVGDAAVAITLVRFPSAAGWRSSVALGFEAAVALGLKEG